jgi:hypothetical protein
MREAIDAQHYYEAQIALNVPPNPLNPGGWEWNLRNVFQAKLIIGCFMAGSIMLVLGGLAVLYWPGLERVRSLLIRRKNLARRPQLT